MNIPAALAADLALLDEVMDDAVPDLSATLSQLMTTALSTVPSYLGLAMQVLSPEHPPWEVTTLDSGPRTPQIGTSLRVGLSSGRAAGVDDPASVILTLFAGRAGALLDLAADLAWLLGRPLSDVRLDQDLEVPTSRSRVGGLASWSAINQALGVLMAGDLSGEDAVQELDARAAAAGLAVEAAAAEILASLDRPRSPQAPPVRRRPR